MDPAFVYGRDYNPLSYTVRKGRTITHPQFDGRYRQIGDFSGSGQGLAALQGRNENDINKSWKETFGTPLSKMKVCHLFLGIRFAQAATRDSGGRPASVA